jgi:pimeloyl-ACP methyl ester carboxylesterase
LGADQLSYFGYSYGTLIGAAYAERHPDRVRAMILDSAIDPQLDFEERIVEGAVATERVLDEFLQSCARRRSCDFYSGGDPASAHDRLASRLERSPIPAYYYEDEEATSDDLRYAVLNALYDERSWIQLAYALVIADRDGDGTGILDLAYPPSEEDESNYAHANSAVSCADAAWPDDPAVIHDLADRLRETAPRVGSDSAYYDLTCVFWRHDGANLPALDAAGAPPILVISATGDAVTPHAWSERLADQLESGVLLSHEGYVHTVSFAAISECVDEAALLYLVDLQPPEDGATCDD